MQSFAAPPALYPEELKLEYIYAFARLDLNLPSLSWSPKEQLFTSFGICMFVCAQWNALALVCVGCLHGGDKGMEKLSNFGSMLASLVSLLSNSAYLIVLPQFLSWLECDELVKGEHPVLRRSITFEMAERAKRDLRIPESAMMCWRGSHIWFALTATCGLILYILPTILVSPFFLQDYTGSNFVLVFRGKPVTVYVIHRIFHLL